MNLQLPDNPYKTLGIERDATEAEIKQAYFGLVREYSPERDPEGFKRIRAAYEKLRSIGKRVETDLFLIDENETAFDLSMSQKHASEPPQLTPDLIKQDLIALEAFLLLEELNSAQYQN
ncbi:MAG: J domain-containing protein [Blastocatellia bacterium]